MCTYDQDGQETNDTAQARYRVPVVRIDVLSTDRGGKLVAPEKAARIEITAYGPNDRFLRHSTASTGR